jgi:hypothetical protein
LDSSSPGVDAIEDIHHHVDRLVGAGHLVDVQISLFDLEDLVDAIDIAREGVVVAVSEVLQGASALRRVRRPSTWETSTQVAFPFIFRRCVELEGLVLEIEVQPGKRIRVSLEELRSVAADDAVQGGGTLLTVEKQLDGAVNCDGAAAPPVAPSAFVFHVMKPPTGYPR